MKTITKILTPVVLLLAGFLMNGCSGFLDTVPSDSLNDETALESIEDFDMVTLGIYETMRGTDKSSGAYSSIFNLVVTDAMSDNLILNYDGRKTFNEFAAFKFYSTTFGFEGFWSTTYNAILSANKVITRLEAKNEFAGTENEALSKNLLAECLAMRGYIHFDLVRAFGQDYKRASDTDLGVPYKNYTEVDKPSRKTVKEVYTLLVADLEKAKEMMTDDYNAKGNTRMNKKGINAILSRIYLTMGDDKKAEECATAAIAGDGSDIVSIADYTKLFTTSMDVPELIFRLSVKKANNLLPGNAWGQGPADTYKSEYCVTKSFADLYGRTDVRSSMVKSVKLGDKGYVVNWKYNGRSGESQGLCDIPMIRTSEIYLTRAEARVNQGNDAGALTDLNLLRERRYTDYEAGNESGNDLEKAIQLERRLELAFEGHRFYDLKRRGEDVVRGSEGHYADGTGVPSATLNVPSTSPYYLFAIPQAEIDANRENMVQNQY